MQLLTVPQQPELPLKKPAQKCFISARNSVRVEAALAGLASLASLVLPSRQNPEGNAPAAVVHFTPRPPATALSVCDNPEGFVPLV